MRPWQAETDGQHVHYIRCFATRSCFVLCICAAPHIYSLVDVARTFHCSRSVNAGSLAPTVGWQVSNWSTVQLLLHSRATFPANPPSLYELPSPPNMPSLANRTHVAVVADSPAPPGPAGLAAAAATPGPIPKAVGPALRMPKATPTASPASARHQPPAALKSNSGGPISYPATALSAHPMFHVSIRPSGPAPRRSTGVT